MREKVPNEERGVPLERVVERRRRLAGDHAAREPARTRVVGEPRLRRPLAPRVRRPGDARLVDDLGDVLERRQALLHDHERQDQPEARALVGDQRLVVLPHADRDLLERLHAHLLRIEQEGHRHGDLRRVAGGEPLPETRIAEHLAGEAAQILVERLQLAADAARDLALVEERDEDRIRARDEVGGERLGRLGRAGEARADEIERAGGDAAGVRRVGPRGRTLPRRPRRLPWDFGSTCL